MDEGALGVDEEHVRNPDLLHQTAVEGHALVVGARERQPLVLPVVTQVQSHGEVLQEGEKHCTEVYRLHKSSVCAVRYPLLLVNDYLLSVYWLFVSRITQTLLNRLSLVSHQTMDGSPWKHITEYSFMRSLIKIYFILTMSTSEMVSRLSTWTSTPTGIGGPVRKWKCWQMQMCSGQKSQKRRNLFALEIKFF